MTTERKAVLPSDFTSEYQREVCKIGQGAACCRYLTAGAGGFECAKRGSLSLRLEIDSRVERMTAQGDNCDGCYQPQRAHVLLKEHHGHPAGTIIYHATGYDYGMASDDTRMTGVEHTSMTLEPSGDYPTFTVPYRDIGPAPAEAAA